MTSKKILAALTLTAFAMLSCTKKNENEIKVGVFGPFTGGSAPMGLSMRNGVQIAIDQINASGGVLGGKKFVMVDRDDEAKNERGGQIMQEFIGKEKVVAVLGPANAGVANASSRYANEGKVPMIINVSAGAKVNELFAEFPENYVFHFVANDDVQAEMIVTEAGKKGFKKFALLCDDTNYGQNGREKMENVMKKAGLTPAYVGKFKIKDTDMTAQLQQAKAAGADVVLAYGIGPELAAISNSMERIGYKVPMIASWTAAMSNYINNAGKNGVGTMMPQTFIESSPTTEVGKKFVEDYRAKYKENPIVSAVSAAQGYDSMYLLKLAIEQAGKTDGAAVKSALEDLSATYVGATGTYNKPYSKTNHEAINAAGAQMGVVQDGLVVSSGAAAESSTQTTTK